ncbi:hypothetical protein CZ794_08640 [Psychrobacter sp. JB385]|nr:hypothetical protein CZ794_08640 [Psychrobacter sp. JB385]
MLASIIDDVVKGNTSRFDDRKIDILAKITISVESCKGFA